MAGNERFSSQGSYASRIVRKGPRSLQEQISGVRPEDTDFGLSAYRDATLLFMSAWTSAWIAGGVFIRDTVTLNETLLSQPKKKKGKH